MAGEPPETISAVWPVFGDLVPVGDRLLREVTFVTEAPIPTDEAMIHLNGITDSHRDDIGPALLDAVPGSTTRALCYLLPDELVASYRFVTASALPRDSGATRAGWVRIHEAGRRDARNDTRLPNPLGHESSVLVAPNATVHPVWRRGALRRRVVSETDVHDDDRGRASLLVGDDSGDGLVIVFDAENWRRVGLADALARSARSLPPVLLVPSGSLQQRAAFLPHPERVIAVLEALRDRLHAITSLRFDGVSTVVAGQSYGGLAAAAVTVHRPDLAATAVAQSGSFHFRSGAVRRAPVGEGGDLLTAMSDPLPHRRFIVQAGTEESGIGALASRFAERAAASGADVSLRMYSGGHDYAWWRSGLFDALDMCVLRRDGGDGDRSR